MDLFYFLKFPYRKNVIFTMNDATVKAIRKLELESKGMKKYKIGELGSVFTGNTPSKRNNEFYESDDIMFIKPDILSFDIIDIKQSNEYLSEKARKKARKKARIIPKGSLLVSCIGNIGKLGINIEEVAFNQQINAIVHNNKITSSKYLAYLLKKKKKN